MQDAFKGRLGLTLDMMGKVMEIEGSWPEGSARSAEGFALEEDRESLNTLVERFDTGEGPPSCWVATIPTILHGGMSRAVDPHLHYAQHSCWG